MERPPGEDAEAMPDPEPTEEEPTVAFIHQLAREGLSKMGAHGPVAAMGVPRAYLPDWNEIQFMVAQLAVKPLPDDAPVGTELVIGPESGKPLRLDIPLLVRSARRLLAPHAGILGLSCLSPVIMLRQGSHG